MAGLVLPNPQRLRVLRELYRLSKDQGATEPVICELDDGKRYYVKARREGCQHHQLLCEAVGLTLTASFRLPVPEFRLVEFEDGSLGTATLDVSQLGAKLLTDRSVFGLRGNLLGTGLMTRMDMLLGNKDRHARNVLTIRRKWSRSPELLFIDFDNLFIDRAFRLNEYIDLLVAEFGLSEELRNSIEKLSDPSEYRRFAGWLRALAETDVVAWAEANLPPQWVDGPGMRECLTTLPAEAQTVARIAEMEFQRYYPGVDLWSNNE